MRILSITDQILYESNDGTIKATLERAVSVSANLARANLAGANLAGANLDDANLDGAKINWQSHDLLAEILRRAAGTNAQRRMVAGLLLVSRDWCWRHFLHINHFEKQWALETLAEWIQPDDEHPKVLDAYRKQPKPEHRPAEHRGERQRSTWHVLDHPGQARLFKCLERLRE